MQMDIAEMARQCDIHRITPLTPAMIAALQRFAAMVGGEDEREACAKLVEANAEACNSRPMKSALLSSAEAIRARSNDYKPRNAIFGADT
jgi:hypothetical protein